MQFIVTHNCFHMLCGLRKPHHQREEAILKSFWKKFEHEHKSHPIFSMAKRKELDLSRCAPIILHGDEGRGAKRQAFLVVNFHGALGRGTNPQVKRLKSLGLKQSFVQHNLNFRGHTYAHRLLFSAMPKHWYTHDRDHVFSTVLECAAGEAEFMCKTGVTSPTSGKQYWAMLIGISGDWPWLHKSGNLGRSFNNVQKRLTVRNAPRGICHLCAAGQRDVPFEQISTRHPAWLDTMHQQSPFETPTPFQVIPHCPGKLADLWKFDMFHTFHIGCGKHFLGSVLALLSEMQDASNVDERFEMLTTEYVQWCAVGKRNKHIKKISKELINWPKTTVYPVGSWHKGDLTTSLMEFVEGRYGNEDFGDNRLLTLSVEATLTINKCFRMLFSSGYFLDRNDAHEISGYGLRFLRRYAELAREALSQNRALFVIMPKEHALHHLFLSMHLATENPNIHYIGNPLNMSTQCDEDFVGRPSRLARRTRPGKIQVTRVLQRYLKGAYQEWIKLGYIKGPKPKGSNNGRWSVCE